MNKKIEITIPVLNEEKRLPSGLDETIRFLKQTNIKNYSIVIADNGSTDNTEKIAKGYEKKFKGTVKYLKVHKKGVGLALRTSWSVSKADIVGYMDVDLATDLKHLNEVYEILNNNEALVVNGSRLLNKSQVIDRKIVREFTSRVFNLILKMLLGVKISDGMCGFKFFDREKAKQLIDTGIENDGWFFCTEMLVKSEWRKIIIKEIPVKWEDDPDSRVKIIRLTLDYLQNIFRLRKEKKSWKKKYSH